MGNQCSEKRCTQCLLHAGRQDHGVSGIIDQLQLSDAEIAAIVGHEIAHALREHTRERVSRGPCPASGPWALAVLPGAGEGVMQIASTVTQVIFGLPHSREQETESDRIGLELMARAGYDPAAAISLAEDEPESRRLRSRISQYASNQQQPHRRSASRRAQGIAVIPGCSQAKP